MIIYDSSSETVFGPCNLKLDAKPDKCLLIFDDEIWDDYVLMNKNLTTFSARNTYGRIFDTYRYLNMDGEKILLVYPTTGAAGSVCDMELLIASGIKRLLLSVPVVDWTKILQKILLFSPPLHIVKRGLAITICQIQMKLRWISHFYRRQNQFLIKLL